MEKGFCRVRLYKRRSFSKPFPHSLLYEVLTGASYDLLPMGLWIQGGSIVDKKMIAFFDELGIEDVSTVGGKCASLGEMSKIGVPVPPGFAVTTEAFDYFSEETGAFDELEQSLTRFSKEPSTIDEFNEMEKAFQEIILAKKLPLEINNAVSEAYDALCDRYSIKDMPVAVRSSGVAEDSPTASFAG